MNRNIPKPFQTPVIIYLTVIYIVGIVGMLSKATLALFMFLVPINILLVAIVAGIYHEGYNSKLVVAMILIYIGGFVIEWLGVKTGAIFGDYIYGNGLGFKLAGVPVVMGLNWLLLVYCSTVIAGRFFTKKIVIILVASTLMLLYDIFLEPSAIRYGFWVWERESVPLQNYLAWFIGAVFFVSLFLMILRTPPINKVAEGIFWLLLAFFGALWVGNN
jgi:putative membrane protein